jgi:hypothetical protein
MKVLFDGRIVTDEEYEEAFLSENDFKIIVDEDDRFFYIMSRIGNTIFRYVQEK